MAQVKEIMMPNMLKNILTSPRSTIIGGAAGLGVITGNFDPTNWLDWVRVIIGAASIIIGAINQDHQGKKF